MKQVYYIVFVFLSFVSCSQGEKYRKEVAPSTAKKVPTAVSKEAVSKEELEIELDTVNSVEKKTKTIDAELVNLDKETAVGNVSVKEIKKQKTILTTEIQATFDESAAQKLQQLLDIAVLTQDNKQSNDMKGYAKESAKNYYADSKKDIDTELKLINKINADSIVLTNLRKKATKHLEDAYFQVTYMTSINYYKQGKLIQSKKKPVDFQFEIVKLNLDGQIFSTIESRILSIK